MMRMLTARELEEMGRATEQRMEGERLAAEAKSKAAPAVHVVNVGTGCEAVARSDVAETLVASGLFAYPQE